MFNPRPRMKGNLVSACAVTYNFLVSIHALTWRATLVNKTDSLTNYYNIQNANIHKILLNKKYGTLFLVPTI